MCNAKRGSQEGKPSKTSHVIEVSKDLPEFLLWIVCPSIRPFLSLRSSAIVKNSIRVALSWTILAHLSSQLQNSCRFRYRCHWCKEETVWPSWMCSSVRWPRRADADRKQKKDWKALKYIEMPKFFNSNGGKSATINDYGVKKEELSKLPDE